MQQRRERDLRRRGVRDGRQYQQAPSLTNPSSSHQPSSKYHPPPLVVPPRPGINTPSRSALVEASTSSSQFATPNRKLSLTLGGVSNHEMSRSMEETKGDDVHDPFDDITSMEVPFPCVELHENDVFHTPTDKELQALLIFVAHLLSDPSLPNTLMVNSTHASRGTASQSSVLPLSLQIVRKPLRLYLQVLAQPQALSSTHT